MFGLFSNLGSIILRVLFAPIEDVVFSSFSGPIPIEKGRRLLNAILFLQGGFGWAALCFGPAFAGHGLDILYGKRWDIAIPALRVYCGLLFVCALNGVLEAYMHAKSDAQWLRINAGFQFANFAILVGAAALLRSHGPIALVCANAASMAARTLVAAGFAYRQGSLERPPLRLPVALLAGGLACVAFTAGRPRVMQHILYGAVVGVVCVLIGAKDIFGKLRLLREACASKDD